MKAIRWVVFIAALLGAVQVMAQRPAQPIRIIVPYAAGGSSDLMIRLLEPRLSAELKQTIVVDHRPGAAGILAAREVARSAPDGHTVLFGNNGPNATGPLMNKDAGYNPEKAFAPISLVAMVPLILTVHPSVPATDLKGLVEYARANPNAVEYGTTGAGSFGHLATEAFAQSAGISLMHVPFKGSGESSIALLRGDVKMLIGASSDVLLSNAKTGKLRLLGVSAAAPTPLAPGAVPLASVVPGFVMDGWFGLYAPAATPSNIVERMSEITRRALADPEVQRRFTEFGFVARGSSPSELARFNQAEIVKWRTVIQSLKLDTR